MPREKIGIDIKRVEELANLGLTYTQIAEALGISVDTLERRRRDIAGLEDAIKKGHACATEHVVGKLMEAIDKGNVTAMIFYLKCRAGWSEKSSIEITQKNNISPEQARREAIKRLPNSELIQIVKSGIERKIPGYENMSLDELRQIEQALCKDQAPVRQ